MTAVQPFCRQVNDYSALVEAIRERTEQMEMAREEIDHIGGLTRGHTDKIISPHAKKRFGMISLGAILQTLGLVLVIIEDPVARDKTLARRVPVVASNQRFGNHCNSKKSLASAQPEKVEALEPRRQEPVSHSHLHVVQMKSRSRFG